MDKIENSKKETVASRFPITAHDFSERTMRGIHGVENYRENNDSYKMRS